MRGPPGFAGPGDGHHPEQVGRTVRTGLRKGRTVTGSNRWRAVGREMRVALMNGITVATLVEPICAAVLAVVLLGERLPVSGFIGGGLIPTPPVTR